MAKLVSTVLATAMLLTVLSIQEVRGCGRGRQRRCPPRDRTPPTLNCPISQNVINRKRQNHQQVSWTEPKAYDNGKEITPTRNGLGPGKLFNEGVTKITYSAKDNSGNIASCSFTITVRVVRCYRFRRQTNGWRWCSPSWDMRYGTTCEFGCYRGFRLAGPQSVYCDESGIWNVSSQPTCEKLTCAAPYLPENVEDITCTDNYYFRSICSYNCREGFGVRQGTSKVRVCGPTGNWIGRVPTCVDVTPPTFDTCPHAIVGYAESSKTSGRISWTIPIATDNSGVVRVTHTHGPSPGEELPVGEYQVTYTATDSENNIAHCVFKVIIKQIRCPTIYPLPYTSVLCPNGHILGSQCEFACDNGTALNGVSLTQCLKSTTNIPYGVWSFGDSQTYCELVDLCPDLIPPDNGAVACDKWLGGSVCQMFCRDGFVTTDLRAHEQLHTCGSNGEWSGGQELPDCFSIEQDSTLRFFELEADYYYFEGNCENSTEEIKQEFLDRFVLAFGDVCITSNQCSVNQVEVTCGNETDGTRKKRDTVGFQVEISISLSSYLDFNGMIEIRLEAQDVVESGFNFIVGGYEYSNPTVTVSHVSAYCNSGSVYDRFSGYCVKCKQGYYHNNVTNKCTKCAKGTYQTDPGSTSCFRCPVGNTTAVEGAASPALCEDACDVGFSSKYGTRPCSMCDVGTYSAVIGSTFCTACAGTKTTKTEGATSIEECQDFDIQYITQNDEEEEMVPARISVNTTNARTSLFAWFYTKLDHCNTVLNVTHVETILLQLNHTDGLSITVLGSSFNHSMVLSDGLWHFVNVSLGNSKFEMFVDGVLVFSEVIAMMTENWVPDELNVTLGGTNCSASFSQFNLNKTAETSIDPRGTCFTGEKGDLLSWKEFLEKGEEGTAIKVQSQCDVLDNCDSDPCQNGGKCTDLYLDFSCACLVGFTGKNCEIDLDDCQDHVCNNNGTCVDGANTYTCECGDGYKGDFCEIQVVNGQWAAWGDWSGCSATCGMGTRIRQRDCTDPAPDNGGMECEGNSTETGECQDRTDTDEECVNECDKPPTVTNGSMNCSISQIDNETKVCVAQCQDGYDFESDFMVINSTIFCGVNSSYRWNIRNEDNPNMKLPACFEKQKASNSIMTVNLTYGELQVVTDGGKKIEEVVTNAISGQNCIKDKKCSTVFQMESATDSTRKRRSMSGTSLTIIVTCDSQATVEDCYDHLAGIATVIDAAVSNLSLTVTYGNQNYDVDVNSTTVDGYVTCDTGSVPVFYYCIPCGYGMYQSGEFCERCPRGYYQDEIKQTTCKLCPEGWTTAGLQSENVTECDVWFGIEDEETENTLLLALSITGALILLLVGVVVLYVYHNKFVASKRPVTPIGADLQYELRDISGKTHFQVSQLQHGWGNTEYAAEHSWNKTDVFTLPNGGISANPEDCSSHKVKEAWGMK